MPDKVGYTVNIQLNTDRKNILYLSELVKAMNDHIAIVEKISVDDKEVFNKDKGGFYN